MVQSWQLTALANFFLNNGLSRPFEGFNGQPGRQQLVRDIAVAMGAKALVETGCYFGDTTGWMCREFGLPVWTCDIEEAYTNVASARCCHYDVGIGTGPANLFLGVIKDEIADHAFVYVDDHWNGDIYLGDELNIIRTNWRNFVVMIDDFEVPDDPDYKFDNHGVKWDEFLKSFQKLELTPYFPSLRGADEGGAKRGCVVLAPESMVGALDGVKGLRRAT